MTAPKLTAKHLPAGVGAVSRGNDTHSGLDDGRDRAPRDPDDAGGLRRADGPGSADARHQRPQDPVQAARIRNLDAADHDAQATRMTVRLRVARALRRGAVPSERGRERSRASHPSSTRSSRSDGGRIASAAPLLPSGRGTRIRSTRAGCVRATWRRRRLGGAVALPGSPTGDGSKHSCCDCIGHSCYVRSGGRRAAVLMSAVIAPMAIATAGRRDRSVRRVRLVVVDRIVDLAVARRHTMRLRDLAFGSSLMIHESATVREALHTMAYRRTRWVAARGQRREASAECCPTSMHFRRSGR